MGKINPYFYFLFLFFIFGGYSLLDRMGLLAGLFFCFFIFWVCLFFSNQFLAGQKRLTPALGQDPWGLNDRIQKLAARLNVQRPDLFISETGPIQAYSTVRFDQNASLVIGLKTLQSLEVQQIEVILLRQMIQIRELQRPLTHFLHLLGQGFWGLSQSAKKQFRFRLWPFDLVSFLIVFLFFQKRFIQKIDAETTAESRHPKTLGKTIWLLHENSSGLIWSASHLQFNPSFWIFAPNLQRRIFKICGFFPI